MVQFRVTIARDLSPQWDKPDADWVVRAATAHEAALQVLRLLGGGYADCIEVRRCVSQVLQVHYLYCNLHAGEFTYDLCCVPS